MPHWNGQFTHDVSEYAGSYELKLRWAEPWYLLARRLISMQPERPSNVNATL
jgi:hypothetical protein